MTVEMKCVPKRNARDERGMTWRSAAGGIGGEHFVGAAARVSGGEAHDLPYRNIRRRTAEAALHQHKCW